MGLRKWFDRFKRQPRAHYCRYCGGLLVRRYRPAGYDQRTGQRLPDTGYWECSKKGIYICAHVSEWK